MKRTNIPTHDPLLAVYDRLIHLAEAAHRKRQQQAAETAVKQAEETTAVAVNLQQSNDPLEGGTQGR